jgi:hypothetical protein
MRALLIEKISGQSNQIGGAPAERDQMNTGSDILEVLSWQPDLC